MRFSSFHCVNGRERETQKPPRHCVEIGDMVGRQLEALGIPADDCAFAFATCQIQLMGRDAHNDEGTALRSEGSTFTYGQRRWCHTRMIVHTLNCLPSTAFQRKPNGIHVWADSFDGANAILDCFGLSMTDVIEYFGNVEPTERKVFDLTTIVEQLAPEILSAPTTQRKVS